MGFCFIKGHKYTHPTNLWIHNNRKATTPQEISETLANTFKANSNDDHYDDEFKRRRKSRTNRNYNRRRQQKSN